MIERNVDLALVPAEKHRYATGWIRMFESKLNMEGSVSPYNYIQCHTVFAIKHNFCQILNRDSRGCPCFKLQ